MILALLVVLTSPADTIFTGHFITLDSARPRAEALAVHRGRISAIGTLAEVEAIAGKASPHLELPGYSLPGFADAHAHPLDLGNQIETIDLHGLSKADVLRRVRKAAAAAPAGAWVRGIGWDQAFWNPPEFPVATELDSVSAGHPVMLDRVDGHAVWVNSRALALARIARDRPDPSGGKIIRGANGAPTGVLVDSAVALVMRAAPASSPATIERRLRLAMDQYLKWGLTSVHDALAEPEVVEAWRRLAARRALPLRLYVLASAEGEGFERQLAQGPEVGLDDGMLTIRSVKVVLDGALGSRGAQLATPYADAPLERGLSMMTDAALDSIIGRAAARGFQVSVHAIGDEANHRLLDAFERAGPAARSLRFRDEHVSMLRDEDLPRFAGLGIIASMQPVFVGEYSRFAEARVGRNRLPWVYRTRDLLESGAVVASGTDYPASDSGDPIATLFALVTRSGPDGTPTDGWLPGQRVSVDQALRSMTAGPAWAAFQENDLGALTVGRRADLTVLSADPYQVAAADLRLLLVRATVVGGRVRYRR